MTFLIWTIVGAVIALLIAVIILGFQTEAVRDRAQVLEARLSAVMASPVPLQLSDLVEAYAKGVHEGLALAEKPFTGVSISEEQMTRAGEVYVKDWLEKWAVWETS